MSHIISNRFNGDVVNKKLDSDDIQEIRVNILTILEKDQCFDVQNQTTLHMQC